MSAQKIFDQLSAIGATVGPEEFVNTQLEWSASDDADPVKFEIAVKKEITPADYEFISFGGAGQDDPSFMARRVSRMVRFKSIGGQPSSDEILSHDDAKQLNPDLLMAIIRAINEVEEQQGKSGKKNTKTKKE